MTLLNEYGDIGTVLGPYWTSQKKVDMPLLQTIVIGQGGEYQWEFAVGRETRRLQMMPRKHEWIRMLITKFIVSLRPRHICAQDPWSPYFPYFGHNKQFPGVESISYHHGSACGDLTFAFCLGIPNRHYVNPKVEYFEREDMTPAAFSEHRDAELLRLSIETYLSIADQSAKDHLSRTTIELPGFGTSYALGCLVHEGHGRGGEGVHELHGDLYKKTLELEKAVTAVAISTLKPVLTIPYAPKVNIPPWKEVPPCPACSWTTEDWSPDLEH